MLMSLPGMSVCIVIKLTRAPEHTRQCCHCYNFPPNKLKLTEINVLVPMSNLTLIKRAEPVVFFFYFVAKGYLITIGKNILLK